MADITNVNLHFLRKARSIAPLSRYAVSDEGGLVGWVPDEMEVRTFHIVRFDPNGRSQILETCNVETLRKTEIAQGGANCLGVTDDDLYLFKDSRKVRFMPDQRTSFVDVALAQSGQRFVCAFSDMLASGHALAYGDSGGRLLWTKDIPFPITRVGISRTAENMVIGGENGEIHVLDMARTTLLRYRQEHPICAVATIGPQKTVFAAGGGVGALDDTGGLVWFTELPGEPLEVATDERGDTAAVLLKLGDGTGRLVFLSADGLPTWDIDYDDARPTGLSLSASGAFAAVTLRDGSLAVYELLYGERLLTVDTSEVLAEAGAARDKGNLHDALVLLKERLQAVPSDALACAALGETIDALRTRCFAAAETAEAVGDWAEADSRLGEIITEAPQDTDVVARRNALRARWNQAARAAGETAMAAGNGGEAEARFLEAVQADPLNVAARELLAKARGAAAEDARARGRTLLAAGKFADAVAAFTDAQTAGANGPEITRLLREARVAEAFELGNELYQDRQYAAALFQFKKALRLNPDHNEAKRKVRYTQNFLQDTQISDRFSRLE